MFETIFFHNYLLMLPIISWLAAQLLKMIINLIINRQFSVERLLGAGGMPSSHSALVCSLCVGTVKVYGVESTWFAFSLVFAFIVMYDAMGVRQETGKQARVLNLLMDDIGELTKSTDKAEYEKKLKEMVGHTPLQVVSGALVGILLGVLIPEF